MTRLDADRLRLARWLRKATQVQLAKKSGTSQATISKIENRLEEGDPETAEAIERALALAPGFLASAGPRRALPPTFYRKQKSMLKGDERWIESVVELARHGVGCLMAAVEFDTPFDLPFMEVSAARSPKSIAQEVRRALMIPDGPISELEAVLESMGVLIIPIYDAPAKFDAMASPAMDGVPDLIFYDPSAPADRVRFNLAHEFGHLVMHRRETEDCEEEANEFAAEFLAPEALVRPLTRSLTLDRALQLKEIWGVSIAFWVYNSHRRWHTITDRQSKSLNVMISQRGWRKDEPGHVPMPQPTLFAELLAAHRENLGYTDDDLGHLFGVTGSEFRERHDPPRGVRVVWRS